MNAQQTVVYTTLVSFVLFILSGRNAQNRIVGKLTRQSTADLSDTEITLRNAVGWGTVFAILLAGADIPQTAEIAAAFAWLLLVSSLVAFGPAALNTITGVQSLEKRTDTLTPRVPPTAGGPS